MKLAFLFPGQGSQKPGLLNDLPACNVVEDMLEIASEKLNESVFNFHSKEALASTKAVQISLLTAGVASFKAFESEGVIPDFVAGHSIGAFSAAVAAGVIDFQDAVKIVALRGELMEQAYPEGYGMGVVLGLEAYKLQSLINHHFDEKYPVFMANQNAPDQITVSGALSGIQKVLDAAWENDARCASLLNVSTPSHCPLLASVSDVLTEALHDIPIHRPIIPYAGNRSARLLLNPVDIRLDLAESISSAVQWHDASTVLYEKGVRLFIEMPPGNVLSRLAAKAFPEARALSVTENGFDDCLFVAKRERLK
ncbi:malonate decarboxylase subunit epsilon [Bacillus sp. ISL-4]|uniref:ACP S-malonyltransferase n=1 Tax=Bacillus sp. ISL-4 TaxID=2819125 RepID=UPI001BE76251|nr:malonate decarboxylase subunit epsilon [Bacillus sp. ISL-4]MBT2669103.1 malonate decarboxylase subunit epsilon [Bacillus sp. ISL-4]MBT2674856.1 malonate decarboxylase subunit epsilon [Streptomyces sp. ISL-14]